MMAIYYVHIYFFVLGTASTIQRLSACMVVVLVSQTRVFGTIVWGVGALFLSGRGRRRKVKARSRLNRSATPRNIL